MYISDKIYGQWEISEPVLRDLINSHAMQRLKGIAQFGPPEEFYHKKGFSRYEHSIGVFLLLRKLGATLEEQVAGLLHDASHTAFSHVIDTVLGDPSIEDFQDKKHLERLLKSDIKQILEKYEIDIYRIADFEKFGLLERNAPDLCADRIDYTLREIALSDVDLAKKLVDALCIFHELIIFKNVVSAKQFAMIYLKLNKEHWTGFEAVSRYYQLAGILKKALQKDIIKKDDLWKTDAEVINKLIACNESELMDKLNLMKEKTTSIRFGISHRKKFRYIDPHILVDGSCLPLTQLDTEYGSMLKDEKKLSAEGITI
ncbi:MAG: hypothetical protein COU51_02665 [Parcubacteria group bacterium CG10_big_fil_rev_8_21_14_0_10_36_14]|nr:MAG: hypothetical protein COU51_02665 [Parcubacteria group bacterium CG10_big_fil_rev_8_21_14_0_10_36_14]